jgi:membrane protein
MFARTIDDHATASQPRDNGSTTPRTQGDQEAADELRPKKSPLGLLKATFGDWMDDDALKLGASLAFYTVWSIGPLFVVVISVASLVFGREAAQGHVVDALRSLVGDSGAKSVQDAIVSANDTGHSVLANIVGVASLLVAASGVFAELKSSLNIVWGVTPKPGSFFLTLKQRFLSLTMVLGTGFLLLVSLLLSAALSAVGQRVSGAIPAGEGLWHIVHLVVSFGVTAVLFTLMFKIIPDAKVGWKDVWLGGSVTALLFTVGQLGIGLYLGKTSVGSAYGAASSLMIILLWIFFSSCILFLGAEFTQNYANMYGSRIKPAANALDVPRGKTPAAVAEHAKKKQGDEAHG